MLLRFISRVVVSMPHAAQTACKSEIVTKMKRSRDTDRDPGPGDWLAGRDLTLNNVNKYKYGNR